MNPGKTARQLVSALIVLIPIGIFGATYFILGKWPNYMFNAIDTEGVYRLEQQLFGIMTAEGTVLTPCEYFRTHHTAVMDILSGLFYLCWVPLPVIYALVLTWQRHYGTALRLTWAFLTVNIIGFTGYYIHPAAPPWYVIEYGFTPVLNTPGNVGGFENFDALVGYPLFHSIYCNNANVFAAIPSLHAAYNPIAFFYAMKVKKNIVWQTILAIVSVGIWFSAVYSCHHYVIDVTLGILTTIIGIVLFEKGIMRLSCIRNALGAAERWMQGTSRTHQKRT